MTTFDESQHQRDQRGRFTEMAGAEQPDALTTAHPVSPPVKAIVRYQRWDGRDDLREIGTEQIDVESALDTLPLDMVRTFGDVGDNDYLFEILREHGMVTHSGPFDLEFYDAEELQEYIGERADAGREAALRATVIRDIPTVQREITGVAAEIRKLRDKQRALEMQFVAATVAQTHPDARFAVVDPQSYPNLFDANHQRIDIDDQTAMDLRDTFDGQHISGSFAL